MTRIAALILFSGALFAQGTTPKASSSGYPVQARIGSTGYGVEYMVRTIGFDSQTFIAEDYLVVEIAIFPDKGTTTSVDMRNFTLRLNGKKSPLLAQTPGIVGASLKYPDWNRQTGVIATAGAGDRGVILGRPTQVERFPGDPRPSQRRLPRGPEAPTVERPEQEPIDYAALVVKLALPEGGPIKYPVSGYLYFPHRGKLESIRKVELLINGGAGEPAVVTLR
jgi:hypothetical protein